MKILLDTHVFIWLIDGSDKLSANALQTFLDSENDIYFSAVSYWEICIKQSIRKLNLTKNWPHLFDREIVENDIKWLKIEQKHCRGIIHLPMIHRDPFDRLLISQALYEKMTILTTDQQISQYAVQTIW